MAAQPRMIEKLRKRLDRRPMMQGGSELEISTGKERPSLARVELERLGMPVPHTARLRAGSSSG